MPNSPRLLFVPVSAPRGTGEYARALAIANAIKARATDADVRFIVSAEAPYAVSVPFPALLLPRSPTFHSREVCDYIRQFRPQVVVFDNAGRTQQLRAARAVGAHCVFVSSRARQRAKAFRFRWMRLLSEHWIAYPAVISGALGRFERLMLRWLKRPAVRFLDVLIPALTEGAVADTLARCGVRAGEYVLVVPGGGSAHRSVHNAPEIIAEAARRIATDGHATLLVGLAVADATAAPQLRRIPLVPMPELIALIRHARLVITNGADTLLQVLALDRPAIAVSLSPDQTQRLARLAAQGVSVEVPLDAGVIESRAGELLGNADALEAHAALGRRLELQDGLATAADAIEALLR
jgi:hypothetical protein